MSEKPRSHPAGSKPAAKAGGSATPAGTKAASTTAKSKPNAAEPDEIFAFLEPAEEEGELGRLAHYRVLSVLGRGGMGTVFMAEDTHLHRTVALKVMLPSIAKKPAARDRFIREARATAAIEHDHIVTIYAVYQDMEVQYLAMQFLKGASLEDFLKAGKALNVPQIMRIGKEIAKGLAAAHDRQLIHRDIKPSNIWLDSANRGRVKILDFGLARPTNEETHLTQEGMVLGTPAYMSPEQARGQNVDARCDLFSLGCVLYRLCAGKLAFTGKDAMSMLLALTTEEPPPLEQINADVPPAFCALVHHLLAKKPEDRPASAKDVVQTIQNIEREWIAGAKTGSLRLMPANLDQTAATGKAEADDPALEESAITELELQVAPVPDIRVPPPRRGSWIFAGLGCSLLTVVSLLCCLGIFFGTDRGQVHVRAEDETAKALIDNAGLIVRDHRQKEHTLKLGTIWLPSGGYDVDPTGLPKGLQIEPNTFALHRGETLEIKIRYVPPTPSKSARPEIVVMTSDQAKKIQQEWAAYLKLDIVDTKAKMILIPPGEFLMGSSEEQLKAHANDLLKKFKKDKIPDGYQARVKNETPQHLVRISKPFYLGANEVTFGQFSRFKNAKGYTTEPESSGKGGTGLEAGQLVARKREFTWINPGYTPSKDHPVTNITWADAERYCAWLSEQEKKVYRLPTEAEWEYACRAGTTSLWCFGDELREVTPRDFMWYHWSYAALKPGNNPATPQAVGRKKSNEFGLHDMHGNVAEMCADYWGPSYYERRPKEGPMIDPQGPDGASRLARVVRGGSFLDPAQLSRSAYRNMLEPTLGYCQVGFRIVCEVPLNQP